MSVVAQQDRMSTLDVDADPDRAIGPPAGHALAASPTPSRPAAGCSTPTGSAVPGDPMALPIGIVMQ
jgi:hypothetical protein